ncbi:chromate transporter [Ideonella margarita]|uniref:Chromate transporter n=1 Tax=Ideonella margarita TaxID=2984191 RepID=A0ABU9CCL4_9BURK
MNWDVLWTLFTDCLAMSLLAIGGAVATVPELERRVVQAHQWLSSADFTASVALAQAAPGPNLLFVAVIGFNVLGLAGAAAAMAGMLLPSTVLTLMVTRWGARRRQSRTVQAFVAGMAPVTLGLVVASGWLLAQPVRGSALGLALVAGTVLLTWRTRLHPLWLILAGAVLGALGLV